MTDIILFTVLVKYATAVECFTFHLFQDMDSKENLILLNTQKETH